MSDELDNQVLALVANLADEKAGATAALVHRLWKDRRDLVDAALAIRDWDLRHSEARSLTRVDEIVEKVLMTVEEE